MVLFEYSSAWYGLSHGRPLWPTIFYLKEYVRISQKNVVDD